MAIDDTTPLNQQVTSILDSITVPTLILNDGGQIMYANPCFVELLNHAQYNLENQFFWDLVYSERRIFVKEYLTTHLQKQIPFTLTTPLIIDQITHCTLNWDIQPAQFNHQLFVCTGKLIEDSPNYFELIAQNSRDVIGILDIDGRVIYMNNAITKITDWDLDFVIGKAPHEFIHPDDIEHVNILTWHEFKHGNSQPIEYRFRRKDGEYVWFESVVRAIPNKNGPPYQLAFSSRNINTRKIIETALIENIRRYRWLMDNSTDMIGIYDPIGICTYISPVCETLLGYQPSEMIGRSAYDFFYEDDLQQINTSHQNILEQSDISTITYRLQHKLGHYVWVETTSHSIRDSQTGDVIELHTTTRDATDRIMAEEQIRKSEAWHRQMFQGSRAIQILINADNGSILDANKAAIEFYGYSQEDLKQMRISDINIMSQAEVQEQMRSARDKTQSFFNFRHRLANGDIHDVEVYSSPINMEGQIILYSIVSDVTEKRRMEAERAKLQLHYRALFEKNNDAIFIIGLDQETHAVNHQAEVMLGYSREELIGRVASENIVDNEQEDARIRFQDLLAGKTLPIYERNFYRKDGAMFVGEINITLIFDDDGNPSHIQSIVRNITERKETENALRQSELQYRTMFEMMGEGALLLSANGSIIEFNQSALDILGLTDTELLDHTTRNPKWRTINPDGSPLPRENLPSMITLVTNEPQSNVLVGVYRNNDDLVWVQINSRPLFLDEQNTTLFGVLVSFAEVTEQKETQDAISESEEKFRSIFESAPIGIVMANRDNKIVSANSAFQKLVGYSANELYEKSIFDITHPDDVDNSKEKLDNLYTEEGRRTQQRFEKRYIHKDEDVILAEITLTYVAGKYVDDAFALAIIEDITERKLAEQARIDLVVERERTQVLTHFIQNASHEFRTPLSIINTSMYLSTRTDDPAKRQEQFDKIAIQTAHINALVDELLLMSRLDSVTVLEKQRLNVAEVLHQVEVRLFPKAIENSIRLNAQLNYNLPRVLGHAEYLTNAFARLIENGLRYTTHGGEVTIRTQVKKDQLIVTISDTGIGITSDMMPKIFDRFFRLDEAHTTRGFGLGLSITKRIIELHDGTIDVTSKVGRGSQFIVALPLLSGE